VILIIGGLAAIALPMFLGQSQKAKDAAAKSLVRVAYEQAEEFYAEDGNYLRVNTTDMKAAEPSLDTWKFTAGNSGGGTRYNLTATSSYNNDGTHGFYISRGSWGRSGLTYYCTHPGTGGCRNAAGTPFGFGTW